MAESFLRGEGYTIKMSKDLRNKPLMECSGTYTWDILDDHGLRESHGSLENAIRAYPGAKVDRVSYMDYLNKLTALVQERVTAE